MHNDTSVFRRKEWGFNEFGPQIGSACAFEWDLTAQVGDSKGILLYYCFPTKLSTRGWHLNQQTQDFGARLEHPGH